MKNRCWRQHLNYRTREMLDRRPVSKLTLFGLRADSRNLTLVHRILRKEIKKGGISKELYVRIVEAELAASLAFSDKEYRNET